MGSSARRLHGQEAVQATWVVADAFGGDEAAEPAYLLGEEDALRRVQLDVLFGAQREEWRNGLEKIFHRGRVEQDFVQPDEDAVQQVLRDDARQG